MGALAQWLKGFLRVPQQERIDLGRRAALAAGATGAGFAILTRATPLGGRRSFAPELVRPPGSVAESDFLARCIRCGECMKVCPTSGIHPTLLEAGVEGLWSPVMNMDVGYCEWECTLCTQVCPTDAIRELAVLEKQKVRIGLAYFDKDRCLPYSYARSCIVCEEHCPTTPKKAIWFEEVEVATAKGERLLLKQPHIDPDLCIGCGICQNKCPVSDRAAVIVTSAGETRNPANQILLPEVSPYG
jgi:ferredoxin